MTVNDVIKYINNRGMYFFQLAQQLPFLSPEREKLDFASNEMQKILEQLKEIK